MQTCFQQPSQTAMACWVFWRLDTQSLRRRLQRGWVEILKLFVERRVFSFLSKEHNQVSAARRGREWMNGWGNRAGGVKVNVWFVGVRSVCVGGWWGGGVVGGRRGAGVLLGPQLGAVWSWRFFFLGAYNDLFKVFLLLLTGPPEVLGFVRRTAARLCLSSTAFWLAWHAWEGHEYWLFQTEAGMLSAGRIVYLERGRTKSTNWARSQE